jgi:hypothetical protein
MKYKAKKELESRIIKIKDSYESGEFRPGLFIQKVTLSYVFVLNTTHNCYFMKKNKINKIKNTDFIHIFSD